jgi:uncharacterized peroxidase-related enzyme
MSWIHTEPVRTATGRLRELYSQISRERGGVSNVLRIHSLLPQTMEDHFNLYRTLMFETRKSGLRRKFLEMVAVVVSGSNGCSYCLTHHSEPLQRLLKDPPLVEALQRRAWERLSARLDPKTLGGLRLAEKLTLRPAEVTERDIQELREVGYDDTQLLHLVLVISYFNFVNRNVLGLGVDLEPDYQTMCR